MDIAYRLIRSERKSLSLRVNESLDVIVRAPMLISEAAIHQFVEKHALWIDENREKMKRHTEKYPEPTSEMLKALHKEAVEYLPARVAHYARRMCCIPEGLRITHTKSSFGSCNSRNDISFSCLLMRYPVPAIDYVVVHELAHIRHKNHSKVFYQEIEKVMPDYKERMALLRI